MKKTIAIITIPALLLMSSFSVANSHSNPEHSWGKNKHSEDGHTNKNSAKSYAKRLNKISKELDLNQDQQVQLKALFDAQQATKTAAIAKRRALHKSIRTLDPKAADYAKNLAAVKQQVGLQAESKIDNMMGMRASLQQILSAEQYEKMQQLKGKHSKRNKRNKQQS